MNKIKQAFAWWSFHRNGVDSTDLVRAAARIGYSGVDLVAPEYWPLIRDHGLVVSAIGGHQSLSDGLNRRENHDRINVEIEATLEIAARNGIPNLIVFSGNRFGDTDDAGVEVTAEVLRRVAPLAEQAEVTLILELLNSKRDHSGYQADRTAWGARVCEATGSSRVRLLYDIYHMQIMEGDLIGTIRDNYPVIAHYHTAGNPGRGPLDESQEIYYPAVIRAIAETGFTGYVAHELVPKGDPIQALEAAYRVCELP